MFPAPFDIADPVRMKKEASPAYAQGGSPAGLRWIFFPASRTCLISPREAPPQDVGLSGSWEWLSQAAHTTLRVKATVYPLNLMSPGIGSRLPLCMEIFTRVVPLFRTWPATYRWRCVIEFGAKPVMSGTWERKGG